MQVRNAARLKGEMHKHVDTHTSLEAWQKIAPSASGVTVLLQEIRSAQTKKFAVVADC